MIEEAESSYKCTCEHKYNVATCLFCMMLDKYKCPLSACEGEIEKEHAWIIWTTQPGKTSLILDLEVYRRDINDMNQFNKVYDYVDGNMKRKKIAYLDTGCVCSHWASWDLEEILLLLFLDYEFSNKKIAIHCLSRLARIKEFKKKINKFIV